MSKPDNAEAIDGAKFRSFEKPDSYWTDPLIENDFFSRTFLPIGTKFVEEQEEAAMLNKVKDKKYKGSDLSDYTRDKFKDENIEYEDDQGENEQ